MTQKCNYFVVAYCHKSLHHTRTLFSPCEILNCLLLVVFQLPVCHMLVDVGNRESFPGTVTFQCSEQLG